MSGTPRILSRTFGWWLGALAAAVVPGPEPFQRRAVRLRPQRGGFAVVDAEGVLLDRLSIDAPTKKALRTVRRASARYLDLDEETVITARANLPVAASADLREAVALRIPELTPFTEDEVVFDLGRPRSLGADSVTVPVYVVPRRLLADWRGELESLGVRIDGIVASETGEATGAEIADFAPAFRRRQARWAGATLLVAGLVFTGGLAWVGSVVSERQEAERRLLTDAIDAGLENVRRTRALEDEIAALSARLASPHALHDERVPPLELLEAVSAALPDDAYLMNLYWENGEVTMTGLAADAPSLIATLEASPSFEGARFSAPVARDQRRDRDRFSLTARAVRAEAGQ